MLFLLMLIRDELVKGKLNLLFHDEYGEEFFAKKTFACVLGVYDPPFIPEASTEENPNSYLRQKKHQNIT